jgi:hypothetical protein
MNKWQDITDMEVTKGMLCTLWSITPVNVTVTNRDFESAVEILQVTCLAACIASYTSHLAQWVSYTCRWCRRLVSRYWRGACRKWVLSTSLSAACLDNRRTWGMGGGAHNICWWCKRLIEHGSSEDLLFKHLSQLSLTLTSLIGSQEDELIWLTEGKFARLHATFSRWIVSTALWTYSEVHWWISEG